MGDRYAGAVRAVTERAARGELPGVAPAAVALPVLAACRHLGARVPGEPCGSPRLTCNLHGGSTTRFVKCDQADRHCATCPDHAPAPKAAPAPAGVVVPQPPDLRLTPTSTRAVVTVVVGAEAAACARTSVPLMSAYAKRVGADFVALDWPGHPAWPMSAKFAVARALDHYERIAYVDADVLLRPGCVDLFEMCAPGEFGAVDELPHHRAQPQFGREKGYHEFRRQMGFAPVLGLPWYLNAGVMVVPRSHRELLLPPAGPIPVGHCAEQDHTNARLLDSGLPYRLLDRRCNWQNWTDPGFRAAPADAVLHWSGAGAQRGGRAEQMRQWAAARG